MAIFEESFLRCECGCANFLEKEVLTIDANAMKYKRDFKTIPIPKNLIEKEIKYVCNECGRELNI